MADENPNPNPNPEPQKDAAYWEQEAKRAFQDRDNAKKRAKELEGKVLSDEQADRYKQLEEREAKAEEERKRKAGEFDTWRTQITDKHTKELQERESKYSTLSDRFKSTVVRAEFGAATDLFGGHDAAKTILDVDLGMAALGKYVEVEDADDDPRGYRIVVKAPNGQRILGKDGNPAPFAEAVNELIAQLPNKDRILRGSGKAGSGSSGGSSHSSGPIDLDALIRKANQGDQDALKELRSRRPAGGMVQGSAWEKRAAR
jgi:hypothetical protein